MILKNNFYYYTNDGKQFTSKLKAFKYCNDTGAKLRFYYNDDVYSQINWKQEPPLPLESYYLQQAQRLRDTYDYLILFYSGGYDSTNILETFYYNNIKIDKIVIQAAQSRDPDSESDMNHNGEIYLNAFPTIEKLGLSGITQVIDHSQYYTDITKLHVYSYGDEWTDHVGAWFSPHHWIWQDIEKIILPKTYKNVGLIFGKDKPGFFANKDGVPGFSFRDMSVMSYIYKSLNENVDIVNFYWDPNFTDIIVKQLHILRRYAIEYRERNDMQNIPAIDNIIYNLKNPLTFKSQKSPSNLISKRDHFLNVSTTGSNIEDFYVAGIRHMRKHVDVKVNGLKPVFSKFYPIS